MAKQTMYQTIKDVEVYGYDPERISEIAQESGFIINVSPIEIDEGYIFKVEVSFQHIFNVVNLRRDITYSATTRRVDY